MTFSEPKKGGLIFEVTGSPACGKTTLLREASRLIDAEVMIFSGKVMKKCLGVPHWIISDNSIFLKFLLLIYAFHNFRIFLPTFKLTFSVVFRMKDTIRMRVYIYMNVLKKIGCYNFIKKYLGKHLVIVDEGLSHIPFNLIDFNSKEIIPIEKLFIHLQEQLRDINLIVLDTSHVDIKQRLLLRGHKRLDKNNVNSFVTINKRIEDKIASSGEKYFKQCHVFDASHDGLLNAFLNTLK